MKEKVGISIGAVIVYIMGISFLVISIGMLIYSSHFKEKALECTAVISTIETRTDSDGDTNHTVYVKYWINDIEYNEQLGLYYSGMSEGDEIPIYYNPDKPSQIMAESSSIIWYISLVMGLIFFAAAIFVTFKRWQKKKLHRMLLENGKKIYAEICEINQNTTYAVNGQNPYVIICSWSDPSTGLFHFFKSENLWFNPAPIINSKKIKMLPVYIDPENQSKYLVYLDEIKNLVSSS